MAEKFRHPLLEFVHRRVLGVHIIAHWGGQHCLPHLLSWLGDGVRAQIDHGQESDDMRGIFARRVYLTSLSASTSSAHGERVRAQAERLKSQRHVGLDWIGSLDAASGQALRDKEGQLE